VSIARKLVHSYSRFQMGRREGNRVTHRDDAFYGCTALETLVVVIGVIGVPVAVFLFVG
jgi:hypothetical protein